MQLNSWLTLCLVILTYLLQLEDYQSRLKLNLAGYSAQFGQETLIS